MLEMLLYSYVSYFQAEYAGNIPARVEVNLISKQNMLEILLYIAALLKSDFQAEYAGNAPV